MRASYSSILKALETFVLTSFVFVCVGLVGINAQARESVDESSAENQAREIRPVSVAIEEGRTTRSILVGHLKGFEPSKTSRSIVPDGIAIPSNADGSMNEVTFTIINGGGRFEKTGSSIYTRTITNGQIEIPAIVAGTNGDEGSIRILIGGVQIVKDIRLATVPVGSMASLNQYIDGSDAALIDSGDGYAVVDESRWNNIPDDSVTEDFTENGLSVAAPTLGLCIRTPLGPGKVKYNGFSPWAVGKRYSYKPENSSSLRRGSGSSDDVDAVYRYSWGCGTALKVPNSCTLTINNSGSLSSCCNAAMAALGHTVKWVNPSSHGFPRCPLAP